MLRASVVVFGELGSCAAAWAEHDVVAAATTDDAVRLAARPDAAVVIAAAALAEADDGRLVHSIITSVGRLPILVVGGAKDVLRLYELGAVDVLPAEVPVPVLRAKIALCVDRLRERRLVDDANRRMAALIEAAPVGLAYSIDAEGHDVHGNATLAAQFDLLPRSNVSASAREEDAGGRRVRYRRAGVEVAPDDLPLQRAYREDAPQHAELEIENPGGRRWTAEIFGAPAHDDDGTRLGAVAITVDVTDRRRIEDALRASERRFRELADSVPQLVWTASPDGTVDYYNSRYTEFAGITRREDGSWKWETVVHPEDVDRTITAWRTAVETGDVYVCEHRIQMADGTFRWHLSRARPVRSDTGGPTKWFGTATDIHDAKLIEARLRENEARLVGALDDAERAMKARDRLASAVSHDLRNPLNTIVTQVGLLRLQRSRGTIDPERLEQGCARIERNAARMTAMLEELLDASRLAAGETLELDLGPVDLREVASQVARDSQASAPRHRIEVTPGSPAIGEWDRARIERVVDNLVSNAVKYSPNGGLVSLSIDREGEAVVLRIRDEGIGIAPDEVDGIFRWFGRGQRKVKGVRGTGIGLSGSRQIAEQHGGSLDVESQPGHGSTFTLRLPSVAVTVPAAPRVPEAEPSARPRDEEDLASSFFRLNLVGFAVLDARTGRFLLANQKLEQLTGFTQEELRTQGFIELTHPDDRASDREKWIALVEGRLRELTAKKRYVRKDGTVTWAMVHAAPITHDGRVVRTVAVIEDITELKETERRLAEAVRVREDFLAMASHELRTPLAALTLQLGTLARLLERGSRGADDAALAKVAGAERSSGRLAMLVDDLLDVAHLTKEPVALRRERLDLADVVREAVARGDHPEVPLSLAPTPGTWDRARMGQVVRLLVRQPVSLSLRPTGDAVELRAEGHAPGGLALEVVRRVVEAHGGYLVTHGASLVVRFPTAPAHAALVIPHT